MFLLLLFRILDFDSEVMFNKSVLFHFTLNNTILGHEISFFLKIFLLVGNYFSFSYLQCYFTNQKNNSSYKEPVIFCFLRKTGKTGK